MTMLRPAAEMKDSGIEWAGLIPKDWGIAKLKYLGNYINGYAFKPNDWSGKGKPIIRIQDLTGSNTGEPNYFDGEIAAKYLVIPGDILVSWAATLDAFVWLQGEGWLNQHIFKAIPVNTINKHYYLWLLKVAMDNMNNDNKHGIVMQHVTTSVFNNYQIPLAPLAEQQAIADYLDDRCSKIDEIIAEATVSIEEYKALRKTVITEAVTKGISAQIALKNSGYEWMGDIPCHWNIVPLKHVSTKTISYGVIKLFDPDDNGVFILRCSDVKPGFIDTTNIRTITKELSEEYKRTILSENDVVINVRGTLGGCAVIPKSMEGYNIAREVALISPDRTKYDSKFIMYYLLSDIFEKFRDSYLSGAIYVGINMDTLSHFRIAYPTLIEQKAIAEYLDKKVSEIDALISEKQALMNDLQAYKKSLIYEVVTGKRRVV